MLRVAGIIRPDPARGRSARPAGQNNAAVVSDQLVNLKPFWEKPSIWLMSWTSDCVVVVRGVLVCRTVVAAERGLIAFTSRPAVVLHAMGRPMGPGEGRVDKMAADMAVDFLAPGMSTVVDLDGDPARPNGRGRSIMPRRWPILRCGAETPVSQAI